MTPSPSDRRARGIALRRARMARISGIRHRVVASALALFVAIWLLIAMLLISGHDPALARIKAASSASAPATAVTTPTTTTSTTPTTRTSGTSTPTTTSTTSTAAPSTGSAGSGSGSVSASSASPSALTSSQS